MNRKYIICAFLLVTGLTVIPVAYGCSSAKPSSAPSTVTLPPPLTTSLTTGPAPTTGVPITSGVYTTTPPPTIATTSPGGVLRNVVLASGENFIPGLLTVTVGTTVTWINKDQDEHTVTSSTPGLFDGPLPSDPGQFSYQFNKPGTYDYYCALHTGMTGTIIVK